MKAKYAKILEERKREVQDRTELKNWQGGLGPVFEPANITYEVAQKTRAISSGGVGAIHLMNQRLGLPEEIDKRLALFKVHLPYHESDHVLNIAYNCLVGGSRLEDIELLRQDPTFMDALGAERLPDPTTAGDFTRRFTKQDVERLMDCSHAISRKVWKRQPKKFLNEAFVDVDGLLAEVYGECKEGMDLSYKGIWGYHPLIVSLANTKEILATVNRPGNATSHEGSLYWINKALDQVQPFSRKCWVRGDTDFGISAYLDAFDDRGASFLFGLDARPNLVKEAAKLPEGAWKPLERPAQYTVATQPRAKPDNVKERIVKERGFLNKRLRSEEVAEIDYQPGQCRQPYRLVIVRKNISQEKGELALVDEIRYFFYITNDRSRSPGKIVRLANQRCDQENVIEQLKNGINAMRMPTSDLLSNWAYMTMASLAWNFKSWYGLLMPDRQRGYQVVRMEFRRFLHTIIEIPCQIIRTGRRIVYRFLNCNDWTQTFLRTFARIRELKPD